MQAVGNDSESDSMDGGTRNGPSWVDVARAFTMVETGVMLWTKTHLRRSVRRRKLQGPVIMMDEVERLGMGESDDLDNIYCPDGGDVHDGICDRRGRILSTRQRKRRMKKIARQVLVVKWL